MRMSQSINYLTPSSRYRPDDAYQYSTWCSVPCLNSVQVLLSYFVAFVTFCSRLVCTGQDKP